MLLMKSYFFIIMVEKLIIANGANYINHAVFFSLDLCINFKRLCFIFVT